MGSERERAGSEREMAVTVGNDGEESGRVTGKRRRRERVRGERGERVERVEGQFGKHENICNVTSFLHQNL